MIINLVGCIATGKSTFAQQWVDKHPSWEHLALDEIRTKWATRYPDIHATNLELHVWQELITLAGTYKNCIIESTGECWRLRELYTPELVHRGIYTIRFDASKEECTKRAKKRNRVLPAPYNGDEFWAIDEYNPVPANLVVDLTESEEPCKVYQEIEWYIWKAYAFHNAKEIRIVE